MPQQVILPNTLGALHDGADLRRKRQLNTLGDLEVQNAPAAYAREQVLQGREDQQYQQGQASDQNKQALAAAQWVFNSPSPKVAASKHFPDIVAQIPGFEQMTDDDVREYAGGFVEHFSAQLGMGPAQPEQYTLAPGSVRMEGDRQIASAPAAPQPGTNDQREYEFAKQQGFPGTFVDYQQQMRRAGATSIDMRSPPTAPQGQVYVPDSDPNNKLGYRLEGIPGARDSRTEAQQKAGLLSQRMQSLASDIVDTAPKISTQVMARIAQSGGIAGAYANKSLTPEEQKHFNAARGWLAGVLRQDTGATIQPFEIAEYYPTFFPVPGDDAPVIEQKRKLREVTVNAISANSGQQQQSNGGSDLSKLSDAELQAIIDGQ